MGDSWVIPSVITERSVKYDVVTLNYLVGTDNNLTPFLLFTASSSNRELKPF